MNSATVELTLYFDGCCAFCAQEMARLKSWNHHGRLAFVDISTADFNPAGLGPSLQDMDREMHGRDRSGRWLVGVDAIIASYTLVDRGRWLWPLRFRAFRPFLTWGYRALARHRYRASRMLGLRAPLCEGGQCVARHPFFSSRIR